MDIKTINKILSRITMNCLGIKFNVKVHNDKEYKNGRLYLQASYKCPCTKTGKVGLWKGSKFQLSKHMTADEIVKRAYVAFESAVKHEVMEGFKVDNIILFNPHVNFEELLKVSHLEVQRV